MFVGFLIKYSLGNFFSPSFRPVVQLYENVGKKSWIWKIVLHIKVREILHGMTYVPCVILHAIYTKSLLLPYLSSMTDVPLTQKCGNGFFIGKAICFDIPFHFFVPLFSVLESTISRNGVSGKIQLCWRLTIYNEKLKIRTKLPSTIKTQ